MSDITKHANNDSLQYGYNRPFRNLIFRFIGCLELAETRPSHCIKINVRYGKRSRQQPTQI